MEEVRVNAAKLAHDHVDNQPQHESHRTTDNQDGHKQRDHGVDDETLKRDTPLHCRAGAGNEKDVRSQRHLDHPSQDLAQDECSDPRTGTKFYAVRPVVRLNPMKGSKKSKDNDSSQNYFPACGTAEVGYSVHCYCAGIDSIHSFISWFVVEV
jgi:hypothetical protein